MSVQHDHYLQFTTSKKLLYWIVGGFKIHCRCCVSPILHIFLSYCTSSLLSLVYLVYFLLWLLPPTRPLLKSLGIPGQRHVKAIRQKVSEVFFSGHSGESKRLQRSVTKTGRCCIPLHTCTLAHTSRFTCAHTCIHRQTPTHGLAVTHIQWHAAHSERIWVKKQTHAILYVPLFLSLTLPVSLLHLCLQGQAAIRSEPWRVFNV